MTGRRLVTAVAAIGAARLTAVVVDRTPLVKVPGWARTNFRGHEVTLTGGLASTLGAAVGAAAAGDTRAVALTLAAGAAGGYDDLVAPTRETGADKGLRGHLAAIRAGRVSGGVVKVVVIGASAWWAVGSRSTSLPDRVVRTVAVAGGANLVNLLDLRPGRAGKVVTAVGLAATPGQSGPLALAAAAAAAAVLPADLGEQVMLGDTGANALGALLALRLASGSSRLAAVTAVAVTGLVLASERVSFSSVIARTGWLRAIDELGRRPA